jgi:cysteine desulfurase
MEVSQVSRENKTLEPAEAVYADFNGSAPLCTPVKEYLLKRINDGPFANPNSIHRMGRKTLMGMEKARDICAEKIGAKPNQIIFNSGSTEGIATIFHSLIERAKEKGKDFIIISGIEHSAVFNGYNYYLERGFEGRILPTLPSGLVCLETLNKWLEEFGERLAFVSVMAANNESGVIQPYQEIGKACSTYEVPFFSDTTQIIGKYPFNFEESGLDFAVLSGHKIGAMTGAGFIMAKNPAMIKPLLLGGGQERGLRGGTQNYLGYETIAVALNAIPTEIEKYQELDKKRLDFENKIKDRFPQVKIIGETAPRVANTTYISYPGIHGQAVQIELESRNIFVSTSSACSDNNPQTSRVLREMKIEDAVGRGVIRISLSLCSSPNAYVRILEGLTNAYKKLSKVTAYS